MKLITYVRAGLLALAVGFITFSYLNPKVKEVYVQVKPEPKVVYVTNEDGTTKATTTIIRETKLEENPDYDSIKEKLSTLAPIAAERNDKLAELTTIKAQLQGELTAKDQVIKEKETEINALKSAITEWRGKYMSVMVNADSGTVKYAYNAEINLAATKKDKRGHALEISASSPDPNFKINGMDIFRQEIKIPVRRFGIGIQGGYYYVPENGRFYPGFGVGASYNLIRF